MRPATALEIDAAPLNDTDRVACDALDPVASPSLRLAG